MEFPRGSLWGKWDLHVHTPASLIHTGYGGDSDEVWERYISDLEALPSEYRVLGINDYIFIDGYKRLRKAKESGRLANIELLLPVIELRLDKFGGTNTKLSRVNYHVIFSNELEPETIEDQFLNALKSQYTLSAQYELVSKKWNRLVTKQSLAILGQLIIDSVPDREKGKFGKAIIEGFNNLNISLEAIRRALDNDVFHNKYLTGVGKTEWWDISWNDKSIADKKTIIQSADFVFIASKDHGSFYKARKALEDAGVNRYLLDCSDAHHYSTSNNKDRIGHCFNWLNADPTFRGLFHALVEYDDRVFVGDEPALVERVEGNKTKYIREISITKKPGSKLKEQWFNTHLVFNPGLVSIIGNKGMGKSALADTIGLLCNTRHFDTFSFLKPEKFKKKPESRASNFEADLTWVSGKSQHGSLDQDVDLTKVERCTYLPQSYFEEITNQIGNIEESTFDKEIKKVIYSHVPETDRLGHENLSNLIEYKTSIVLDRVNSLRTNITKINLNIFDLERKQTKAYKKTLQAKLEEKNSEILVHNKQRPRLLQKPRGKSATAEKDLSIAMGKRDTLNRQIADTKLKLAKVTEDLSKAQLLQQALESFQNTQEEFSKRFQKDFVDLGINFEQVISFVINMKPVQDRINALRLQKRKSSDELDLSRESSKVFKLKQQEKRIKDLNNELDKPMKQYQKRLTEKEKWQTEHDLLVGTTKKQGTKEYYKAQINEITQISNKLLPLYENRDLLTRKLYRELIKVKNAYADLYKPVQDFIGKNPEIGEKISFDFDVSILNIGFTDGLFSIVARNKKGAFSGVSGSDLISSYIEECDFNDEKSVIDFIQKMLHSFQENSKDKTGHYSATTQLRSGQQVVDFYDYIYSLQYLQPRYVLKMGNKDLAQLSPGERGALLLVFYLLVDKDNIPLIVDQPEHNLDNQTIFDLLVPAIKKAKRGRQIIIVTHSPNLAVVCDSDQIIWAALNIKNGYSISYESGSLENPNANQKVIDILEGTWGSFSNRGRKYSEPQSHY